MSCKYCDTFNIEDDDIDGVILRSNTMFLDDNAPCNYKSVIELCIISDYGDICADARLYPLIDYDADERITVGFTRNRNLVFGCDHELGSIKLNVSITSEDIECVGIPIKYCPSCGQYLLDHEYIKGVLDKITFKEWQRP